MTTFDQQIHSLPANEIVVGATKPRARKEFDPEALALLTENIHKLGQKVPGICFVNDGGLVELIAGERRLKACQALGANFAYVLEEEVDDELIRELEIMENLHRENLTWQEEIFAFRDYHRFLEGKYGAPVPGSRGGHTLEKTAKLLGVAKGRFSEDVELAEWVGEVPEVANARNKTEAKKVVKRLKDMSERAQLLEEARLRMAGIESVTTGAAKPIVSKDLQDEFLKALKEHMGEEALAEMKQDIEEERAKLPDEPKPKPIVDPQAKAIAFYEPRCILGDMEEEMVRFQDGFFDVVVFDPPWGVDFDEVKKEEGSQNDYSDDIITFNAMFPKYMELLWKKMRENSHLYLFFGIANYPFVYHTLERVGFETNGIPLIWHKLGSHRTRNPATWPGRSYEPIAYARKGTKPLVAKGAPDLIQTPMPTARIKKSHPSAKNPAVILDLLRRSVIPGDRVLDPMAGSGMTGVAAMKLSHSHQLDWYMIEKNEEFRELALFNLLRGYDDIYVEKPADPDEATEPLVDFRTLTPGTPEWGERFKHANPEEQDEMLAWRKENA
jgi:ParB family chromosome partitioning protein